MKTTAKTGLVGIVLAGSMALGGCKFTPGESKGILTNLGMHAGQEIISSIFNPNETTVNVNGSQGSGYNFRNDPNLVPDGKGFRPRRGYYWNVKSNNPDEILAGGVSQYDQNIIFEGMSFRPRDGYAWNDVDLGPEGGVYRHEESLIVQHYVDDNKNNKIDPGELLGNLLGPLNFDKEDLRVEFDNRRSRDITFTIRDSSGQRISQETTGKYLSYITQQESLETNTPDWIDSFKRHAVDNPGKYTLYVSQEGLNKTFSKDIVIE
jgi:hypothetical protein